MNLNMVRPKNKTGGFLLSKTENCETLIEQTHRKAEEILEFKVIKPRKTFHFNPTVESKQDWMIRFLSSEVYSSFFFKKKAEKNNKFSCYTDTFGSEFSFTKLKDKVAQVLGLSDISDEDLEDEIWGPDITKTHRKLSTRKKNRLKVIIYYY